jgi:CMP-N-acetylneuraminic acid synthetase
MNPNVVGFIFARGGSKGVPRKNIRPLAGKPLLAYAIETALESTYIERVIVSTDDIEIAKVAQQYGADVPFMRPADLARDDSPEWLVWQHALISLKELGEPNVDVFVCVPTTAPLRIVEDLDNCIQTLLESDADLVITVKAAERNPYFNMVFLDDNHNARLVIPTDKPIHHRQTAPLVYDMTTVAYVARPAYILQTTQMFTGKVKAVVVPVERALDIDTELDFKLAELLIGEVRSTNKALIT